MDFYVLFIWKRFKQISFSFIYRQQNGQSSSESSDDLDRWLPVFVGITDRELR